MKLKTKIKTSEIIEQVCSDFTYEFQDTYEFECHNLPEDVLPHGYNIGLIVGSSGSGKSLLLKEFGKENHFEWDDSEAVCSHFDSYKEAQERLIGSGFNAIPQWLLPFNILSAGQQYRVNLAKTIESDRVYDEFTSIIDRGTALGLSKSIQKLIRSKDMKSVVFASVHNDIIPYLQPDWIYNTDDRTLTINSMIYDITNMQELTFVKKNSFMSI